MGAHWRGFVPGVLVAKCAECGVCVPIQDTKFVGGVWVINHKTDCSQQYMARPFIYTEHQATNPSHIELEL